MKMATDSLRDAEPSGTTIEEWKDIDFDLRISLAIDKTSVKTWDDIENEFDEKMVDKYLVKQNETIRAFPNNITLSVFAAYVW